jgi:hypothetical protein
MPDTSPAPGRTVAWAASVLGGEVVAVDGLDLGGTVWWVTVASGSARPRQGILRLNELDDSSARQRITTEAAALAVVSEHGVAAPELLASDPDRPGFCAAGCGVDVRL